MKIGFIGLLALGACLPATTLAAKSPDGPDVLVVSDALKDAPEPIRPSPGKPVYYVIMGGIEQDLGNSVAGEKMPAKKTIEEQLIKVLAAQGFIRTALGGPIPSIVLVYSYGTANLIAFDWEEPSSDPANETGSTTYQTIMNRREIMQLVGADKPQSPWLIGAEADEITAAANEDRLYVVVAALDAQELRKKKKKLVWRTRISIASLRNSLPESLETMLASAAPYFGSDSDKPVVVTAGDRRNATVKIGPMKIINEDVKLPAPAEKAGDGQGAK